MALVSRRKKNQADLSKGTHLSFSAIFSNDGLVPGINIPLPINFSLMKEILKLN
jgi:hypothetical protein